MLTIWQWWTSRSMSAAATRSTPPWRPTGCLAVNDRAYRPPSLSPMRRLLIRIDPAQLDAALRTWHGAHGLGNSALVIDGNTIRGAIDGVAPRGKEKSA